MKIIVMAIVSITGRFPKTRDEIDTLGYWRSVPPRQDYWCIYSLGDDAPLKYQLKPVTLEGRQHIHKLVILVGDNDNAVGGALRAAHVGPTS